MRKRTERDDLTVNVIAGNRVVFFGMDLALPARPGFRGFGFHRRDADGGHDFWLRGMKRFEAGVAAPAGSTFSSREQPFQAFQWADYTVEAGREYVYKIVALYGSAGGLTADREIEVAVETEPMTGSTHSAFFNRGAVATQEYARRFHNEKPSTAGPEAYEWLSRGLLEALVAFLNRAVAGWEVHAAVYEFQWPAALAAVRGAKERGAVVRVLFDDIAGASKPSARNRAAIDLAEIRDICEGRSNSSHIMHNKFFVLSREGVPRAVWTGSTNLTENGIFGHSNLGHIVEDEAVARAYLDYWTRLQADPKVNAEYRAANAVASPLRPVPWNPGTTAVFSPRGSAADLDALEWYADIARSASKGLFMTFAFGMNENFRAAYNAEGAVLKMALLEKVSNAGAGTERRAAEEGAIRELRNRPNVVVAIGNRIVTNKFDEWLAEIDRIVPDANVHWIHTKYMLVDPLGETPIVVSGSANFSEASNLNNDENMLVIRGDKRIADIYFGEYMRLYTHYAFRESVARYALTHPAGSAGDWKPQFLIDSDDWMKSHFDPFDKSARCLRREYFSGPMAE